MIRPSPHLRPRGRGQAADQGLRAAGIVMTVGGPAVYLLGETLRSRFGGDRIAAVKARRLALGGDAHDAPGEAELLETGDDHR
jgi:hypothetical protein